MNTFYFPLLNYIPVMSSDNVECCGFSAIRRKWDVSIFDIYSLVANKHKLRVPAEILQIFLPRVNMEIAVEAADISDAAERLNIFRAMLYLQGMSPTIAPFAGNMSLNCYAGINARSGSLRDTLPDGLREGMTDKDGPVEIWANELSFNLFGLEEEKATRELTDVIFKSAAQSSLEWKKIEADQGDVRAARRALVTAPLMPDYASSILHIWQGIESLFPTISSEITFRTSLLLAELASPKEDRLTTYEAARSSYKDRSRIAHGSQRQVSLEQWFCSWCLLRGALEAILDRGQLPSEETLTRELLRTQPA